MATKNPQETKEYISQLREWISNQPRLPQKLDDQFLVRFLHSCYYDLQNTQKALELFFRIRSSLPEVLSERDLLSPQMQRIMKILNLGRFHADGSNVWIWQLNDPGLNRYEHILDVQFSFLNTDTWILEDDRYEDQDILIMDAKDVTLKLITKCNWSVQRKYFTYMQEAMPFRLEQIHIVNTPPFFDKIYTIFKPLLKKEIRKKIYLHTPNSETLFDHIRKENIPQDFGGSFGTMEEHMKDVVAAIMRKRDVLQDNLWAADEVKIEGSRGIQKKEEIIQDIRKLEID